MTQQEIAVRTTEQTAEYIREALTGEIDRGEIGRLPIQEQAMIAAALAAFHRHDYIDADGWLRRGIVPTIQSLLDVTKGRAGSIAAVFRTNGLIEGNNEKGPKRKSRIVLPPDMANIVDEIREAMARTDQYDQPTAPDMAAQDLYAKPASAMAPPSYEPSVTYVALIGAVAPEGNDALLTRVLVDQLVVSTNGNRQLIGSVLLELAERFGSRTR